MIVAYWLWLFGTWLTGVIPEKTARRIARGIGLVAYYTVPGWRHIARQNMAHVLGRGIDDPKVGRVARQSIVNFFAYLYEMLYYPHMSIEQICERVDMRGCEPLVEAMSQSGPVILVSGHFGQMDWAGVAAARKFQRPFTLAAETIKPVQVFEFLVRERAMRGAHLIPYDRAPRKIIEAVRRNEFVGFMLDFGYKKHEQVPFVIVNFFGAHTRFTAVPAQLARKYHAPIVVGFPYLDENRIVHVQAAGPFWVPEDLPKEEAARFTMQEIAHSMEPMLARFPEQWYVFRDIWPRPGEVREMEQQAATEVAASI